MAFGAQHGLRVSGIYKILNTKNGKFYIGSSVQVEGRIFKHLSHLRAVEHRNAHLQAAFNRYGETAFEFILIETCGRTTLLAREQHHIDTLNPAYNVCRVAGNTLGYKHGADAKVKMSEANKGNQRNLGKRHSPETRQKISASKIGGKLSEQHKRSLIGSLMGNKHTAGRRLSEDHKAKVSASLQDQWDSGGRNRDAAADRARARWSDPAWKERQLQRIREGRAAKRASHGKPQPAA